MVYDSGLRIVFQDSKARKFLDRQTLPAGIRTLAKKIFNAIAAGNAVEMFPGFLSFTEQIDERQWVFRVAFRGGAQPLVCVYFSDETISCRFDLNALRQRYRLTRRETDVLRQLLDGKKNLEIAEELALVEQTVKDYLSSVYRKIGVEDRFSLLRQLAGTDLPPRDPLPG